MSYGYIYRTTCFPSGRVYIGQKAKSGFNRGYLGSGKLIRAAIVKHGRPQFMLEVLEFAESKRELDRAEQRQIIEHRALLGRANVYNITPGGEGFGRGPEHPSFGKKATPETKAKLSAVHSGSGNYWYGKGELLRGEKNPHFGKHLSLEARAKIGAAVHANSGSAKAAVEGRHWMTGKKWSPELREKLKSRRGHRGKIHTDSAKQKISEKAKMRFASGFKCAFTPETRYKISEGRKRYCSAHPGLVGAKLGSKLSEETKQKIGEAARRRHAEGRYTFLQSPDVCAKRIEGLRNQKRSRKQEVIL